MPAPIFRRDSAVDMRVLVPADAFGPGGADGRAVDHDVRFERVEPGLRVLVAAALDADVAVGYQELD